MEDSNPAYDSSLSVARIISKSHEHLGFAQVLRYSRLCRITIGLKVKSPISVYGYQSCADKAEQKAQKTRDVLYRVAPVSCLSYLPAHEKLFSLFCLCRRLFFIYLLEK